MAAEAQPLSVLLSRSLGAICADVDPGDDSPSLAVWSNVLRLVGEGIEEREFAPAARISSRLATAATTGSARRGWITAELTGRGKNRRLQLTDLGFRAATLWPKHLAALDANWKNGPLRSTLEKLVAQLRFELPHYPATYGTADPSAIGGPYMQGAARKDGIPAHGNDWKPVLREEGDTVTALPVTALLSQALMAYTIDYEDRFPWPLASTMLVLRYVTEDSRPLDDLPKDHEITGNGKSLLERHLIVVVTKDSSNPKTKLVHLHDRGKQVLHHHPERIEAVESEWRERFGAGLIGDLRRALEEVAPASGQPDHILAALHLG